MNRPLIELKALSRKFGRDYALKEVSLVFPKKGFFAIVGPSGSGKTTLLNIIAGLDEGYSGTYLFQGKSFALMNDDEVCDFRAKHIGYVFQNLNLFELESSIGNVLMPMDQISDASRHLRRRKARDLLSFVGLSAKEEQRANILSGGEKQRVALARALASDPDVLLADEPSGSLDEANAEAVFGLMHAISQKKLVIVVSHDRTLCGRYADTIIEIRDGVALVKEGTSHPADGPFSAIHLGRKKEKARVSSSFFFLHAFRRIKEKKWRSLLSELTISLGLLGLGISSYVSSSISNQMETAISSILPENQIVMSPHSDGPPTISNIYGATYDDAEYLCENYPDYVRGYGSSFLLSYEQWFADCNQLDCLLGASRFEIPGFSVRTFNDYLWLEENTHLTFYPRRPARMDDDEIILGLPYATMFNLCFGLHILRNYQALGDFILAKTLHVVLACARLEWGFEDEELFRVIAVTPSNMPCIYHTSHFFNRSLLIEKMQFRSSLQEDTPTPQYAYEVPYISLKGGEEEFLREARRDTNLDRLLFEKASYDYASSYCPIGGVCSLSRLYLHGADKNGISWQIMDKCREIAPKMQGKQVVTAGSYFAEAGNVALGFPMAFFLSPSKEKAEEAMDAYGYVPSFGSGGKLPEGVKDGGVLSSVSGGLRIGAIPKVIQSGRKPESIEEILLSSSLREEWKDVTNVYAVAAINEENDGNWIRRDFRIVELKVVGYVSSPHQAFYVQDDWTVDFFFSRLGMSSSLLEPEGACFYFENKQDVGEAMGLLSKELPDFRFYSPTEEVASSVEMTVSYIGKVLFAFSFVSLLLSGLLLVLVVSLSLSESQHEAKLLRAIGVNRNGLFRFYYQQGFLYCLLAFLPSCLGLFACQAIVGYYIASAFGAPFRFFVSFNPFLVMVLAMAGFLFLLAAFLFLGGKKGKVGSHFRL